ncbi:MAG: hypothetical protein DCC55_14455 [Chloroflexi bacterium]|nr:MAG: hypothetical protein DCC55_14455 [Chloroflexota bacterium]
MSHTNADLTPIRERQITLMQHTLGILGNILAGVDQATMTTLRDPNDGAKGWTALEVLCHLRDYDEIFYQRACLMLEQEYPHLPGYDHEALAIERRYNEQDFRQVYDDLVRSRQRLVEFFQGLTESQWARAGVHPERGHFTMTDACVQVGTHEALHLEQITRILRGR